MGDLLKRFWSKIVINPNTNCWEWQGFLDKDGYGSFRIEDKKPRAHRASYELFKNQIPKGLQLDHLCKNRKCVNPEHLEVVTCAENIKRGLTGINNRLKTHCPKGHEYIGNNLSVNSAGTRRCRQCWRDRAKSLT